MKKFFCGLGNLIKRHKLLFTICLLAFVIVVVMMYVFFSLFIGGTDKYGMRLKDIESHEITSKDKKEVVAFLEEKGEVNEATMRTQGRIIYIHIEFTRETSLDRAKEIANESLSKIDEENRKYYDVGFSLTQVEVEDSEDIGFVATGTKSSKLDHISWIKS